MGGLPLGQEPAPPQGESHRLWSVAGIGLLVLVGAWALAAVDERPPPDAVRASSSTSATTPASNPAPLASDIDPAPSFETNLSPFGGVALKGSSPGSAMATRDLPAIFDAWTVAVRRDDGSLGHHGAVVTFPVTAPPRENRDTVTVGAVEGVSLPGHVVWPLGGQYARVRGDLSTSVLAQIAAATVVVDGRPQVTPPAGYRVLSRAPLRAPLTHAVFYVGQPLGLTFTGLTRGGGFEDALYATTVTPVGLVHGAPAVASDAGGGRGTVAWEPKPGLVAYVGWGGVPLSRTSMASALALAQGSHLLTAREWLARRPRLVEAPSAIPSP